MKFTTMHTSLFLPGPPSASKGNSYTLIGVSPSSSSDSKKATPSSAGVLGVLAVVGDSPLEFPELDTIDFGIEMLPGWARVFFPAVKAEWTLLPVVIATDMRREKGNREDEG